MAKIEDRLTVLLPMPAKMADELRLEFEIDERATLYGQDPDDPEAEPKLVLDAFSQGLKIVKVAGDGPLLVSILEHLAEEARRAWDREMAKRQEAGS